MAKKIRFVFFLSLIIALLTACAGSSKSVITATPQVKPLTEGVLPDLPAPSIVRHPDPVSYSSINPHPTSLPKLDPNSTDPFKLISIIGPDELGFVTIHGCS